MTQNGGVQRRSVIAGAGAVVAALAGFSSVAPSVAPSAAAPHPARLTAVTDPDLVPVSPRYADVAWDPDSGVRPLRSDRTSWWLVGSSTAEFAGPHVAALAAAHGVSLYRDAKAGETDAQICARMGLAPERLCFPADTVPSGRGRVWGAAAPLITRASARYEGVLEGTFVAGSLGWDRVRGVPSFERLNGGAQAPVGRSVRLFPTASPAHRADVALFLGGGKNSVTAGGVSAEQLVAGWRAQHAWLVPRHAWFLRQGFFANVHNDPHGAVRTTIDAVNAWGRRELGPRFLDVAAWLGSAEVWDAVGVRPGPEDLRHQRWGHLPPALADRGGAHLSDAASEAWVRTVVGPRMLALGWV